MSGNGTDQGHMVAMLQQVIATLGEQSTKLDSLDRKFGDLDRKVGDLDRKVGDLDRKVNDLAADVVGLRQTVTHYHGSVLGHAFLITDLEHRVQRIESHLEISPTRSTS